jgi:hypothetical protein
VFVVEMKMENTKMKYWILGIVATIMLASCYVPARKVYQFESINPEKVWLQGRELIKLEQDSVEIVLSYDHSVHGVAWFDLAISNKSSETYFIDPTQFSCIITNKFQEEIKNFAMNPEFMLYQKDKQIEQYKAANQSSSQTELLFTFFDVVDDIADKDESEEENRQENIESELRGIRAESYQQKNMNRIDQISNNRNFIENAALRKTTLFPDQQMGGKLFFELEHDITKLIVTFPIGTRLFQLEYRSIKY